MGLMDKFKNLFTDEEIIEDEKVSESIEIKEIKKEEPQKLPTFMREKIKEEENEKKEKLLSPNKDLNLEDDFQIKELRLENKINMLEDDSEDVSSAKKYDEKQSFKFPMDLTDNDFVETRSRQSVHNKARNESRAKVEEVAKKEPPLVKKEMKVAELYKEKKKELPDVKKFKATPIISPIYGVLDKNYTPVEVETNKGDNLEYHRHSKSVDFDSVRKKAYGSITEEIKENLMCENCEYLKEAKECKKERERKAKEVADNLVYDVLEESRDVACDITLDEATENYYDYGVEYEKAPVKEEIKIVNHEVEEEIVRPPKKEIPPVKSSINLLSTLKKSMGDNVDSTPTPAKDLELTDDLFNLIDSMYDERNDS